MKFSINKCIKFGLLVLSGIILIISCKKSEKDTALLPLNDEQAVVTILYSNDTIYGNWAAPSGGPTGYGAVYLDLSTGNTSTSLPFTYHVSFTSYNNGVMTKANGGDDFRYLNTTTALASLTATHYTAAATVPAGFSENTVSTFANTTLDSDGWYNYNRVLREVKNTENVVFFYTSSTPGSPTYVFKVVSAWAESSGSNTRIGFAITVGIL